MEKSCKVRAKRIIQNVQESIYQGCDRAPPLGQNTAGRKSPKPAESPRGTNEVITPIHNQERADAGEEKEKTEERGGGDTVVYRRENEGKRQQEEESEEKQEEEDPERQEDHKAERELWRGVESNGGCEGAHHIPVGTWLI
ncbi:hypothetical protein NDU88_001329 [Pleurodeles waltl]|uniref:Uncharacterized protein n=1 Tax=Pleurodeles waltl TaxID=8319 RepID=A0AAV7Q897_PLEWA|nr:hypothetical protein NDU88_001329 [Pleurodeles waltl]